MLSHVGPGTWAILLVSIAAIAIVARFWSRDARRAALALRESEQRYRSLVGSLDDFVFTLDAEQRYSGVFGRWAGRSGLDAQQLLGRTPAAVFGDDAAARHEAAFRRVMGGSSATYEWQMSRGDAKRYLHTSMSPLRGEDGAVIGAVGVARDVTEKTVLDEAFAQTNEMLHMVVGSSPVAIFTLDEQGRIRSANAAAESIFAKSQAELLGELLVRPAESEEVARMIRECALTGSSFTGQEVLRWRDDGSWTALSLCAAPLAGNRGIVALATDITEKRRADEELERDRELIALQTVALESAANAVVVTDLDGTIRWVNPAFVRLTGWTAEEAIGQKPSLFKSGNHSQAFYKQMWETLIRGMAWTGEMWNRRKDGTLYIEEQTITPVRTDDGRITHYVAIKQDVTARRRSEDQIRHLAMHDALTDLPNRRALDAAMERISFDARRGVPGALMILDVDNFKPVNDTLGHIGGDQLLAELARLLRQTLRPADFLARLGGDEFAVLLQDASLAGAEMIADRVRKQVSAHPFRFGDRVFDLTVSIGIAAIDATIDASAAMVRADSAMYAAKDHGQDRIVVYRDGEESGMRVIEAGRWATRIRKALRDGRFVLCYQPVVRIGNGATEHYEALLRMIDEDGTTIAPEDFISAAERFGLMSQIDQWVVENVLQVLAQDDAPERIFVNISGASLGDADLLAFIEKRIEAMPCPPGRLAFEITESAAIRDLAIAQDWIRKLKQLGCLFAIDDFGVGFSSFSYLRALSADYVKIDRSFVMDVDTNPTNRALVQAVMTVAQTLGKEVIAEGVETEAHEAVLVELGIELAQGYRWGKPLAKCGWGQTPTTLNAV